MLADFSLLVQQDESEKSMKELDYHTLMHHLTETVNAGRFGQVEIVALFNGRQGRPVKFALREEPSGEVDLGMLEADGTITFRGNSIPGPST